MFFPIPFRPRPQLRRQTSTLLPHSAVRAGGGRGHWWPLTSGEEGQNGSLSCDGNGRSRVEQEPGGQSGSRLEDVPRQARGARAGDGNPRRRSDQRKTRAARRTPCNQRRPTCAARAVKWLTDPARRRKRQGNSRTVSISSSSTTPSRSKMGGKSAGIAPRLSPRTHGRTSRAAGGTRPRTADIDDEVGDQQSQAFDDPLAAVVVVFARERVHSEQIRTSAAATLEVISPRLAFADDFPAPQAGIRGALSTEALGEPTHCVPLSIRAPSAPRPSRNVDVCLLVFCLDHRVWRRGGGSARARRSRIPTPGAGRASAGRWPCRCW